MDPRMRFQTLYEARWIFAFWPFLALVSLLLSLLVVSAFCPPIVYTFASSVTRIARVPADPNAIVAAADGMVTDIVEIDETMS